MTSNKYSASELLALKSAMPSEALLNKVKMNSDLADIVKPRINGTQPRRQRKPKDDIMSSTDSEDRIVFHGKKQTRTSIGNLKTDTQWKYRGRNNSETSCAEPLCAPSGIEAQKSEGFQRFFKAVVSPTHVRVTAGGRIVPNTRVTTSPTAKLDRDFSDPDSDSSGMQKPEPRGQADEVPAPHNASFLAPPMVSPMYSGYHPLLSPVGPLPMPLYPVPNGMPFPFGMPQRHGAIPTALQNQAVPEKKHTGEEPTLVKTENGQETRKPKPAPIKISPPEQFDRTRPYFFNGHVYYPGMGPLPAQAQPSPLTPSPYLGGLVHPGVARYGPSSTLYNPHCLSSPAVRGSVSADTASPGVPVPQQAFQSEPKSATLPSSAGVHPPLTSIKPSDITKSQLSSLRFQLKYYNDQLQYNKHQIDEDHTQDQMQTIRNLIEHFERNFRKQLAFEAACYPDNREKELVKGDAATQCQTPLRSPSIKDNIQTSGTLNHSIRSASRTYPGLNHAHSIDHLRTKAINDLRQRVGINSSKGNDTSMALGALEAHLKQNRGSESPGVALPTRAAMAPPFEPRGTQSQNARKLSERYAHLDATQGSDGGYSGAALPLSQNALWLHMNAGPYISPNARLPSGSAFAFHNSRVSQGIPPYLVGSLPQGINPQFARATDYTYARELTNEEKRARHVYWGRVSTKGLGLPKFDGKDFYPPSPVKDSESADMATKSKIQLISGGRHDVDFGLKSSKKTDDPFSSRREADCIRTGKNDVKFSHAIPIVNPETGQPEDIKMAFKGDSGSPEMAVNSDDTERSVQNIAPAPAQIHTASAERKEMGVPESRPYQRPSKGSTADIVHSMLRKIPTSVAAVPSALTSTVATGYLPHYSGHAAASLSPAVMNINGGATRALMKGKGADEGAATQQAKAEMMGKNCPPQESASKEAEIIADLHQRMLRDAERRGVIGPGWQ